MASTRTIRRRLARSAVAACVEAYRTYRGDDLPDLRNFVANLDPAFRAEALAELVRIDLELRWRAGNGMRVEDYLRSYPELGTLDTVSVELLCAEFDARRRFEGTPEVGEYERRFPRQWSAFRKGLPTFDGSAPMSKRSDHAAADGLPLPRSVDSRPRNASKEGAGNAGTHALPRTFGRYRVLEELGKGAMATCISPKTPSSTARSL